MDAAKSGAWRVFTSTLRALSRLDAVRLAAIIPADREDDFLDLENEVEIVRVGVSPTEPLRNIVWHALFLPRIVLRLGADVLHVPAHNLLVSRKVCPTVITIHDITEFHLTRHYDPLRTLYRRFVVPRNARLADRIATVSHWTGTDIADTLGVARERIVVAPNGVDPAFRPVPRETAQRVVRDTLAISTPYLLYVGQIHMPNKNLVRLVEAFANARPRLPSGTSLVLAGREVTGAEEVRAAIRRRKIEAAVRWVGYVPDGTLTELYSAALAFCYPSLHEGFGLPVIEAMSCGTPVVTSNTTGLDEIAREAALQVDPTDTAALTDALVRAVNDQPLRAQLIQAGLNRARCYSWDATAKILADLYCTLASRTRTPSRVSR